MSSLSGVGIFWAIMSFIASVGCSIGFYMPYWLSGHMYDKDKTPVYFGVFRRCNYPRQVEGKIEMVLECGRYTTFLDIPSISWQIATLTLGVGCGLAMLVAFTSILAVCIRGVVTPSVAKAAGIIQLCSGLLMGAGVGIYPNGWDTPEVQQACGYKSSSYNMGDCEFFWSFYLVASGSGLTLICSLLSCHAPEKKTSIPEYQF
ncbi:hypothetical protein CHS0354_015161 [Potamilus streckersoni]|uniref:LHFPL tetraspan subfamily member 6 protein n=1 Tax=Potamilus streckersoni TaxID=2493646 RepID=A0AAE0SD08_9BIVA|nr:hypothetical protein CHS0354_015161 [Potamilus streckersoni]